MNEKGTGGGMRILNISAQKPDSTGSGVYLAQTVRCELEAGCEAAVICGIGAGDAWESLPSAARVRPVRFDTPELPFHVCGMSDVMPYPATRYRDLTPEMVAAFERAFGAAVDEMMRDFRPDVVICHHLYLLMAIVRERVRDVPVAGVCHSTDLRQLRQHALARERIGAAARQLDAVLALHGEQAREIEADLGIAPERIAVVGTGFDGRAYHREEPSRHERGRILYVGKICRAKGVGALLEAFDRMGGAGEPGELPVELRLVGGWSGDGRERDELAARAARCTRPAHLLGRIVNGELVEEYQHAQVFVLPSYFEGLPLVIMEAIACGCVVVATDLPGVRPWLESHVQGAPVIWVEPPRMHDVDVPVPEDVPAFEARLAHALEQALSLEARPCDMRSCTWEGVAERILGALRRARGAELR